MVLALCIQCGIQEIKTIVYTKQYHFVPLILPVLLHETSEGPWCPLVAAVTIALL